MKRLIYFIVLFSLPFLLNAPLIYAGRSPFEASPGAGNSYKYNYPMALETLTLKGLIYSDDTGMAVFQHNKGTRGANTQAEFLICEKGEKFVVVLNDLVHTFRVNSFKGKKVILIAGNRERFEVTP